MNEKVLARQMKKDKSLAVRSVNGRLVTITDILDAKRFHQSRRLEHKRRPTATVERPCFVWVFYVDSFLYGGWWLYVKTTKGRHRMDELRNSDVAQKIRELWPCGETDSRLWIAAFAEEYPHKNEQGRVLARAVIAPNGDLLDVTRVE